MEWVDSKRGVPIRLTDERWYHIVENHDDLAGYYDQVLETVENPDYILSGGGGALIAAKGIASPDYSPILTISCQRSF